MDEISKMWHECSILCEFLSKHDSEISSGTRQAITMEIEKMIARLQGLQCSPEPF